MDAEDALKRLRGTHATQSHGRVQSVVGLRLRASIPDARVGDLVSVARTSIDNGPGETLAEVVGFDDDLVTLVPFGSTEGIGPNSAVTRVHGGLQLTCGPALLGRVVDGLGKPIDGGAALSGQPWPLSRSAPAPLSRARVSEAMPVGIRAIDSLLTVGKGQRVGLFAGSGVGKSTLMGQLAHGADADVIVVALIGERGREVREFLEDSLTPEARQRSVVVCATSDASAVTRLKSAYTATAIAEYFRNQGNNVLLLMDSVTRFARAARSVALAAGELPARRGYPASVFSLLPRLLERAGTSDMGSITALYTVLVEGGDMEEPIADEVRGILDGHIVLNRKLAARQHWPAIDVLASLSRVMPAVVTPEHRARAGQLREWLAAYESHRDLIAMGAYQAGSRADVDEAIARIASIETFLKQTSDAPIAWDEMHRSLAALT